jgi:hypothetical protein
MQSVKANHQCLSDLVFAAEASHRKSIQADGSQGPAARALLIDLQTCLSALRIGGPANSSSSTIDVLLHQSTSRLQQLSLRQQSPNSR